ncbi:TfoX/Sxy family DNA transformation protein [Oceanirhabdus seepicola]|uniref:TfoX/Sxy family DNA transformation protein n=1 Tax=Oceanirhabdus seepicola TaxID=2828781 RepID=A0A9J6NXK0_9CLOT|nr:TfoX/Sxy family DNA transformation protein [Oceanirhabdus seepicola]
MNNLSKVVNIGKSLEEKLNKVGINSYEELKYLGTNEVIIRLKNEGLEPCLNMSYAIEGAIKGVRWHGLSEGEKKRVREIFERVSQ